MAMIELYRKIFEIELEKVIYEKFQLIKWDKKRIESITAKMRFDFLGFEPSVYLLDFFFYTQCF